MNVSMRSMKGKSVGECALSDVIFQKEVKPGVVHEVLTSYIANGHPKTSAQKNRSAVRGGGAKPWRQKGTGRARAGTSRGPIWRGGGVTFGRLPQKRLLKVNQKVYQHAIRMIFSELLSSSRLHVIDALSLEAPKTRSMVEILQTLAFKDVLFLDASIDGNVALSARNLHNVAIRSVNEINPLVLLQYQDVCITQAGLAKLEEKLS